MTRTKALLKLLEHGPLTTAEIVEIMGGKQDEVLLAVWQCEKSGQIQAMKYKHPTLKEQMGLSRVAWRNTYALA